MTVTEKQPTGTATTATPIYLELMGRGGIQAFDSAARRLRGLDIVIAMRFHAAIFALAQGREVIGIDYRIGKSDKVAGLLDDFGQSANCGRIDEMSSEWLCQRLCALARVTRTHG